MADVFISYSGEDQAQAEKLAAEIEAVGLTVWWDRKLLPAEKWPEVLQREIDAAAAVLVIWTPASVGSDFVGDEAEEARAQGKLTPIRIGDCRPPIGFRRYQHEDFSNWSGQPEALCFQRLAIQLVAFARGEDAADALPLDDATPPRLGPAAAPTAAEARETAAAASNFSPMDRALGLGAAAMVAAGFVANYRGWTLADAVGPYAAWVLAAAASALALFRAAELALPAGQKALVARWLAGERSYSSGEAFLTMFEAVFGKRHWTLFTFWRSVLATLLVYLLMILLFMDLDSLWTRAQNLGDAARFKVPEQDWQLKRVLEENAVMLLILLPLTNILADYLSLWQTRKILEWSAGALPLWIGVVLDAALTAAVFILTLPLGPIIAIAWAGGFSPEAFEKAIAFTPEVWRGLWMIFEGHPWAEIDAALGAEASLSTTTLLIALATTFITSVWLWLALSAAPLFWLMNLRRGAGGAPWLLRAASVRRQPIFTLGCAAAGAVLILGFGGREAARAIGAGSAPAPFQDCEDCPWMVSISGGDFQMGAPENDQDRIASEGPQVRVEIARFAIGVYEVTFREWKACQADGFCKSQPKPHDFLYGRGLRPVIGVSWNDVTGEGGFIDWLNSKVDGAPYRLPSEAEWEYAARAGGTGRFWTGDSIDHTQANFDSIGAGRDGSWGRATFWGHSRGQTLPVGAFEANPFGLHDVHGNVAEWVQDCWALSHLGHPGDNAARRFEAVAEPADPYAEDFYAEDPPPGAVGGCEPPLRRVVRGGRWDGPLRRSRAAARSWNPPDDRVDFIGFRVARDPR